MMTRDEFAHRLLNACEEVIASEDELTQIDAKFGDADHGLTMVKVASAIRDAVNDAEGGVRELLDDAAMAVMVLNGGSAVPLWNTWLDGMQESAPDADELDAAQAKAMFANALTELADMSGAQVGDKTMMDALIPASEAVQVAEGDVADVIAAGAAAAEEGAENSKNFPSKFGRAKSYGDKTIGTPDAGAVSMARFWRGLARA